MEGKKKVLVSVINDLVTDQRVHRSCTALSKDGFEVCLIGRRKKDSLPMPDRPYSFKRMKLIKEKGALFYAEFSIRLFFKLLFSRCDVLFSNDLDTLLPNYLVSKIRRKPLFYDTHEYFCGVPELQERPKIQAIWRRIESRIFPRLKSVITVNQSIAELYEKDYQLLPGIVRNVPFRLDRSTVHPISKVELNLPEDKKVLLLQGAGINIDRGAEEMVEAMKYIEGAILLIVGSGDVVPQLKTYVKENQLDKKVLFIPKQPLEKLRQFTLLADIGLTLDKDTNINYRYSLPNKLFDYIQAGKPVLASNLPEVRRIVETYGVGCVFEHHAPEEIAKKVDFMIKNQDLYNNWTNAALEASKELCWEEELNTFVNAFKRVIAH